MEIETVFEADTEISVDGNAEFVLAYILAGAYEVIPKAYLSVHQSNGIVRFTIRRTLQHYSKQYNREFTLTTMQIAMIMLYRLGSERKIRQEENNVIFEFALPIVESES